MTSLQERTEAPRSARNVTLADAIGVGGGPRSGRTALLVRAFETQHDVLEAYYGSAIPVAVALVRDRADPRRTRVEFECGPDVQLDQNVEELLFRAYSLSRQIHHTFPSGRDRALCLQLVYGIIAGLFKEVDRAAAGPGTAATSRIGYLETACDRAEKYFARAAQRRAQLRYLSGVLGGLTVISAAGYLLAQLPEIHAESGMYLASLIGGGIGALLSVLFGMTSGNLRLHTLFASAEAGPGPLVAAGALRPLLGALSGTVVYVLLRSGLVPLEIPDGAAATHFFIALAIVAGFSERWARGVLAGTEERIPTTKR